jgi:hypothetical protein
MGTDLLERSLFFMSTELERKLEEALHRIDRLEAAQACRNLMGKYSYYHTAFRNKDYMTLWAKREDSYFKFPFGQYIGYEAIAHCYLVEHGDRDDPGMDQKLQGIMTMHELDTEVLEVAADCKTAKGVWISPGHETFMRNPENVDPAKEPEKLVADPMWAWSKYEVEFIRDTDGTWKLWHMVLYPLFKTGYHQSWTEGAEIVEQPINPEPDQVKPGEVNPMTGQQAPDFWQWSPTAVYPAHEPEPPVPYENAEQMPHKIIVPEA